MLTSRISIGYFYYCCLVSPAQFSHSVVSNSLLPHGLKHARLPCLSPPPRVYSNSSPLTWRCHPTISSSVVPFSSYPQSFPASRSSNESVLHIRWPKYWSFSFSISPSYEYSGLISFRIGRLPPGRDFVFSVHWSNPSTHSIFQHILRVQQNLIEWMNEQIQLQRL